jgi:N-acetylmuramoyl-L-alanine amidase|tara:strand:+ start:891 stop:1628 length:738 start_codon:yes stop_codon:yes gene_type:complete
MTAIPIKTLTNYSPNFSTYKRNVKSVKYLIYHYTGMRSESKAINRLTDDKSKVSCHYFIKRNGSIIIMVPDLYEAWHAGKSNWKKDKSLNKKSIGIEISNKGHKFGYENYSKKQIKSLIKLSKYLIKKYSIKKSNILGHSDISFDRKKDPGEKFPWQYLSKKKISYWHNIDEKKLIKLRNKEIANSDKIRFFKFLFKIGYFNNILRKEKKNRLIKSFQRRFRQKLTNGKIDLECLLIAKTLSKIS